MKKLNLRFPCLKLGIVILSLMFLVSCKGSSSSSSSDSNQATQSTTSSTVKTGVFLDDRVAGIDYLFDSKWQTTNSAGEYQYKEGEEISFKIGDVSLGKAKGGAVITPLDFGDSQAANNMVRFLTSLDDDTSDSVIQITSSIRKKLEKQNLNFDQAPETFETAAKVLVKKSTGRDKLTSVEDAEKHFNQSLEAFTKDPIIPSFYPQPGTYNYDVSIDIRLKSSNSEDKLNTKIHYTTDGSEPSLKSPILKKAISLTGDKSEIEIKALAVLNGKTNGKVVIGKYKIDSNKTNPPEFSLGSGIYRESFYPFHENLSVPKTSSAKVYYTTDGSLPTENSIEYSGHINIKGQTIIKAVAIDAGKNASDPVTAVYQKSVDAPIFKVTNKEYNTGKIITLRQSTGADIHYTTDGNIPTVRSSVYTSPIQVKGPKTIIKAIAVKEGIKNSKIITNKYELKVTNPKFSIRAGNVTLPRNMTINALPFDATVYYSTDPTQKKEDFKIFGYGDLIRVDHDMTVRAYAKKAGYKESDLVEAVYTIRAENVQFAPRAGVISAGEKITLKSKGATAVYYTLDGSDPIVDARFEYTKPIELNKSTTIKAIAVKNGVNSSEIVTADYSIWNFIDRNQDRVGLNKEIFKNAYNPQFTVFKNKLYSTWVEDAGGDKLRVKAYDSVKKEWEFVAGDSSTDVLNKDLRSLVSNPQLTVFKNKIYAIWQEGAKILVKRSSGDKNWEFAGDSNGINQNKESIGRHPQLAVFDNELYAVWYEEDNPKEHFTYKIQLKKYNLTENKWKQLKSSWNWPLINGSDSDQEHLELPKTNIEAMLPQLTATDKNLYLIWQEKYQDKGNVGYTRNRFSIHVKEYDSVTQDWTLLKDGTSDTLVEFNDRASTGYSSLLIMPTSDQVDLGEPQLVASGNELFAIWTEEKKLHPFAKRVMVKKYNKSAKKWNLISGEAGLNFNSELDALRPQIALVNGKIYAAWEEKNLYKESATTNRGQIRVKEYLPGTNSWKFVDGGKDTGINRNKQMHAMKPQLIEFQNKLCLIWQEWNFQEFGNYEANKFQIRVAIGD